MGIPHNGFAMIANSSKPFRIDLARGVSLPNAVMNAIKNTASQTAMNSATAPIPRFQFCLMSFKRFRMNFSPLYFSPGQKNVFDAQHDWVYTTIGFAGWSDPDTGR
jgi:hypothetical protein